MYPKPNKLIPAVYGGIIVGLISSIPFLNLINVCCCAGVMCGGIFAVSAYKSNFTPETPPFTSEDCMIVGGLAGLIGALVSTFISTILLLFFGDVVAKYFLHALQGMDAQDLPPALAVQMPDIIAKIQAGLAVGVTVIGVFFDLLFHLVVDIIFGGLGGLIAYGMFRPKTPVMPPPMRRPPGM
jgi:hypothetical protein